MVDSFARLAANVVLRAEADQTLRIFSRGQLWLTYKSSYRSCQACACKRFLQLCEEVAGGLLARPGRPYGIGVPGVTVPGTGSAPSCTRNPKASQYSV